MNCYPDGWAHHIYDQDLQFALSVCCIAHVRCWGPGLTVTPRLVKNAVERKTWTLPTVSDSHCRASTTKDYQRFRIPISAKIAPVIRRINPLIPKAGVISGFRGKEPGLTGLVSSCCALTSSLIDQTVQTYFVMILRGFPSAILWFQWLRSFCSLSPSPFRFRLFSHSTPFQSLLGSFPSL